MWHLRVSAAFLLATLVGCASITDREAIKEVLTTQVAAWNRGDVDGFMDHYVHSDDLTFSSGGKTTRGWQATKDRYHARYPDAKAMGVLSFSDLEPSLLAPNVALVLGNWHLTRDDGRLGGNFSLVFRKIGSQWVIVHDHTSRREASDRR